MEPQRQRTNQSRRTISAIAIGITILLTGYSARRSVAGQEKWRFTCPDDSGWVKMSLLGPNNITQDSVTLVPLSEPITNIPEYHDCQRFIDSTGQYLSVYAIFAAFRLDAPRGWEAGSPVATIYTPDGTYDALGILPGFNCLVVSRRGRGWTASMVSRGQGSGASDCTSVTGAGGKQLEVKRQVVFSRLKYTPEDYPAVARWDWDSLHKKQYIGIRCEDAWCEIGAEGFKPSPGYTGKPLSFDPVPGIHVPPTAAERVQRIKGWYDAQRLAMTDVSPQRPSRAVGFLIPSPALELINERPDPTSYYRRQWVHVGYAVLEGGNYPKWNFDRGANKIYFCYGTANPRGCGVPAVTRPEHPGSKGLDVCEPDPNDSEMRWWAKTVSASGVTSYSCVKRTDHGTQLAVVKSKLGPAVAYALVGTARWKFLTDDESTWHGCPTGCCTKQ